MRTAFNSIALVGVTNALNLHHEKKHNLAQQASDASPSMMQQLFGRSAA
jgi:hypothetical protein